MFVSLPLKVCSVECSRIVCIDCVWYTTSSNEPLEVHEEFIHTHVSAEFQMYGSSSGACEKRNVGFADIAPHPDIQWSSEVYAGYREWL